VKHVTYGEKSLLMDDDAADSLLEYARLLGQASQADTVTVRAVGMDGNTVEAAFLLNESSVMMVESTNSAVDVPENREAVQYMQQRIDQLNSPPEAMADESGGDYSFGDIDLPGLN